MSTSESKGFRGIHLLLGRVSNYRRGAGSGGLVLSRLGPIGEGRALKAREPERKVKPGRIGGLEQIPEVRPYET